MAARAHLKDHSTGPFSYNKAGSNYMSRLMTKPINGCAPSEDSDQPGHPPSLIRVFACTQWVAKDPIFLHADSEDFDQTGRMPRLI